MKTTMVYPPPPPLSLEWWTSSALAITREKGSFFGINLGPENKKVCFFHFFFTEKIKKKIGPSGLPPLYFGHEYSHPLITILYDSFSSITGYIHSQNKLLLLPLNPIAMFFP